jgi:hypothetical protein
MLEYHRLFHTCNAMLGVWAWGSYQTIGLLGFSHERGSEDPLSYRGLGGQQEKQQLTCPRAETMDRAVFGLKRTLDAS